MLSVNYNSCTGCYACQNICPKDCIKLVEDKEGFFYPQIDTEKCINCGLCEKICPAKDSVPRRNQNEEPKAYACYAKDDDIRAKSMTGGISYLCGKYIIEQGGVVFGAVGSVLERVYHTKASTLEELESMRNSKYLQSEVGNVYQEAKEELLKGRLVLFTGTPCQIEGLYAYLGAEYEGLFTLDLICHGVPSKKIFHEYILDMEAGMGKKIISYYRDKTRGWRPCVFSCELEDGKRIPIIAAENSFNYMFATNMITRKSCQKCKYARIPRVADITVGDYLQGNKSQLHDKDNKGLSLVTINSKKGMLLYKNIESTVDSFEYSISDVVNESEHLAHSPRASVYRRTAFWMFQRKKYRDVVKLLVPSNRIHKNLRRIYGVFCYIYEFCSKDSVIK